MESSQLWCVLSVACCLSVRRNEWILVSEIWHCNKHTFKFSAVFLPLFCLAFWYLSEITVKSLLGKNLWRSPRGDASPPRIAAMVYLLLSCHAKIRAQKLHSSRPACRVAQSAGRCCLQEIVGRGKEQRGDGRGSHRLFQVRTNDDMLFTTWIGRA